MSRYNIINFINKVGATSNKQCYLNRNHDIDVFKVHKVIKKVSHKLIIMVPTE